MVLPPKSVLDESRFLEIFPSGRKRKSFVICGARRDAFLARCDFSKNGVPNPVAVLELLFILEAFFEALERASEEFMKNYMYGPDRVLRIRID